MIPFKKNLRVCLNITKDVNDSELGILSLSQNERPDQWTLKPDEGHVEILQRGASLSLVEIVKNFGSALPIQVPVLWNMSVLTFLNRYQWRIPIMYMPKAKHIALF